MLCLRKGLPREGHQGHPLTGASPRLFRIDALDVEAVLLPVDRVLLRSRGRKRRG